MERENEGYEELPETLIDRLRRDDGSVSLITPKVDRMVLDKAKSHFASRRRIRPQWVAVAATIVLGIFVMYGRELQGPPPTDFDIDASGRIDIVDAMLLARRREQDPDSVSQADIEALAMRIVSLAAHEDAS